MATLIDNRGEEYDVVAKRAPRPTGRKRRQPARPVKVERYEDDEAPVRQPARVPWRIVRGSVLHISVVWLAAFAVLWPLSDMWMTGALGSVTGAVVTFGVVHYSYRREWDRLWYALRYSGYVTFIAAGLTLALLVFAGPPGTTQTRDTTEAAPTQPALVTDPQNSAPPVPTAGPALGREPAIEAPPIATAGPAMGRVDTVPTAGPAMGQAIAPQPANIAGKATDEQPAAAENTGGKAIEPAPVVVVQVAPVVEQNSAGKSTDEGGTAGKSTGGTGGKGTRP